MSPNGSPVIVGERVELDRYTVNSKERVIYGQRINGTVRLTDRPAHEPGGRSYLIETGLEQDGYAALSALLADYLHQARRLEQVPMASSIQRATLQAEAA